MKETMDLLTTTITGKQARVVPPTGFSCYWYRLQHLLQQGWVFVISLLVVVGFFVYAYHNWWRRRIVHDAHTDQQPSPTTEQKKEEDKSPVHDGSEHDQERRGSSPSNYRFRKRDKVLYGAKKLMRKVRNLGRSSIRSGIRSNIRPAVARFAATWLSKTKEKAAHPIRGPPSAYFEPDTAGEESGAFPPEVFYMLRNIRVFGHFETSCFLELCRHVTEILLPAGQYLFRPGDSDDSIYVVQKGHISVFIKDQEQEFEVKKIGPGESVLSLLSILDVLTGHSQPFKTVAAKANMESTILKLSGTAFNEIFERYPESWVRTIQIIALRLQRVTFTTLHHYLGLSTELQKPTLRDMGPRRGRIPSGAGIGESPNKPPFQRSNSSGKAVRNLQTANQTDAPSDPKHATSTTPSTPTTTSTPVSLPSATSPLKESPGPSGLPVSRLPSGQGAALESENYKKVAMDQLTELLGLQNDRALLENKIHVQTYPPGHTLTEQGSENVDLIYVLTGALELSQRSHEDGKPITIALVYSHEMVGGLAVLTGEPSFYTIKTRMQSRVAILSKEVFYQILTQKPRIVLSVAHTVVQRLSPFIRSIDFSLDWEMCDAGKALYNQGDPADSLYVVLSGRLRTVAKKSESNVKQVVGEYGRGDLVGLVEVLTARPRATTAISVRYTELSKLPIGLLNFIKMKFPQVLTRIIHLLGHCILGQQDAKLTPSPSVDYGVEASPHVANLNTIAIAALSDDVPLSAFALELMYALKAIKPTRLLSREVIERDVGQAILQPVNDYRLFSWLSQQEDAYSVVLYQCDYGLTPWSRRCIRQADCVLIVANGQMKPGAGPLQELFERVGLRAQKNLILLWDDKTERPTNTQEWLDVCGWVSSHYHIRTSQRLYIQAGREYRRMAEYYEGLVARNQLNQSPDFARLARMMTGRAIGVVLGGGGARGASHMGVLRALKEHNVPIDFVGGTSIGSLVGGLYCSDPDVNRVTQKAREWFMDMSGYVKHVFDLTYPHVAMFSGAAFNRTLKKLFGDLAIEDLWLPYFNITTDISSSEMRVHRNGPLWRYCRASMSLAGYYPPICDPLAEGHYLLDGGYVNNLPADVMRSMGVGEILAIDVGSVDEKILPVFGDSLSGWPYLFPSIFYGLFRLSIPPKVLNMPEIQSRLAYVSCVRQLEAIKKAPYCFYVRPPIDKYQTLDFPLFDEIMNVGYQHCIKLFSDWERNGKMDDIRKGKTSGQEERFKNFSMCGSVHTPQSFIDLAAFVSKINYPKNTLSEFSDDDTGVDDEDDEPDLKTAMEIPDN